MKEKLRRARLCKWDKKDIARHIDMLSEMVSAPAFVCGKCGRAVNEERNVCRPIKMTTPKDDT